MIDTHCHLTHARLQADLDQVLERARDSGLVACLTIGTGSDDARRGRSLAARWPGFVFCSAGIDPFSAHRSGDGFSSELDELRRLLDEGSFRALGEVGLDYHYDLDPPALQAERFEAQLALAAERDLPVILHVREAHHDMLAILARHPENRGVVHSFSGGPEEARAYLGLGWHLAFNGVLTFRNAEAVREAARVAPAERILVETDSPYLAPTPHRGQRCEPSFVKLTARRLAEVRSETVEQVERFTTENAERLFALRNREP